MVRKKQTEVISSRGIRLRVATAAGSDVGKALARVDPDVMEALDANKGDVVEIVGKSSAICRILPAYTELRGTSLVQLDGVTRDNVGALLDEVVTIRKTAAKEAEVVCILPMTTIPDSRHMQHIKSVITGLPVLEGTRIRIPLFGGRMSDFLIESTVPKGAVSVTEATVITLSSQDPRLYREPQITYEDIGGMRNQIRRLREMLELPLRFPETFERLGIGVPKGVILQGPSGCGKSLLAKAIAHESKANFQTLSGQELVHMARDDNESLLRRVFDEACHNTPSIIFIDELDAVAPAYEKADEAGRRMVAQLLILMDSLKKHKNVIVIGATDNPRKLDPSIRRGGRFDREVSIPIPDRNGRHEILEIHTRGMPLSKEIDLKCLAKATHGFVGEDLEALCREASVNCLRTLINEMNFTTEEVSYERFAKLEVDCSHFHAAMQEVEPSAIRETFVEIPDVRWTDIGGLETVKEQLVEAVKWPSCQPYFLKQACVSTAKCILLAGPSGCGKTMLAKAVAAETLVNFISINGPALLAKHVDDAEMEIRDIFHKARRAAPCIIFFDEIDAIVASRGTPSPDVYSIAKRLFSQFLVEMDSIGCVEGMVVIAATNHLDRLDAVLNSTRHFNDVIEVPMPDVTDRIEIFKTCLANRPIEPGLDIAALASKTKGFTGAQIAMICDHAAIKAVRRAVDNSETPDLRHLPKGKKPDALIRYDDIKKELAEITARTVHE